MSIESLNAFSMDFFSLKGKTAIVTGGNSGLGQAFAMALAKAGANIFIPSFVKDNGETKEMIEKQGVEVDFMQVDITAEGAPQKIIAACCERFGTVDILVNNAGICKLNKVLDFGRADWDPMIDVTNVRASRAAWHVFNACDGAISQYCFQTNDHIFDCAVECGELPDTSGCYQAAHLRQRL